MWWLFINNHSFPVPWLCPCHVRNRIQCGMLLYRPKGLCNCPKASKQGRKFVLLSVSSEIILEMCMESFEDDDEATEDMINQEVASIR